MSRLSLKIAKLFYHFLYLYNTRYHVLVFNDVSVMLYG